MHSLSQEAWKNSATIIEAIKAHPFNQSLMKGDLSLKKFGFYIEQDALYLQDFARALAYIAATGPLQYVRDFLRYSEATFIAEQEVVHQFFRKSFHLQETGKLTPATLSYTSYLLRTCTMESLEVAIAAVLPCFWVYQEVGLFIAQSAEKNNPYSRWIETYASEGFGKNVKGVIDIFDSLAQNTTETIRQKMLDAFYKSTCLEWHFWNDAYHQTYFDELK